MFKVRFWLMFLMVLFLAACSSLAETPQRIAAYPAENQIAVYPVTPPDMVVVYTANIELTVSNVDKSVEKINNLAYEYGGYLTSSQTWYQENKKHTTVALAVPISHFDTVHRAVLGLGDLVHERVLGELQPAGFGDDEWRTFSTLTVHLHPKASVLPAVTLPDWRPVQTFSKAWDVFAAILAFLVDILIWVGVVAGPFVLLGWGLRCYLQGRRTKN